MLKRLSGSKIPVLVIMFALLLAVCILALRLYAMTEELSIARLRLSYDERNSSTLYFRCVEKFERSILAKGTLDNNVNQRGQFSVSLSDTAGNSALILDKNGCKTTLSQIPADALLRVTFDGQVLSSDPAQIIGTYMIEVIDES